MKAIVLLNSAAGTLASSGHDIGPDSIQAELEKAGIQPEMRLVPGEKLAAEAREAAKANVDVVIVGGGDGTVGTVAGAMAGSDMPLGVLPLGTLNHFAKDLGVPQDLEGAVAVIAGRRVGRVDLGQVNEHTFINNSSLGVYPYMVLDREAMRSRLGIGKWLAMVWAMGKVAMRFPLLQVRLTIHDEVVTRKSPLVFVGNNAYQLDLFNIGKRACLDRGELCLYVATAQTRWAMFILTLRALVGRLHQSRDFEMFCLTECTIESRRRRLHVAADGEVTRLAPPLEYRVLPGELLVCLPPEPKVNATDAAVQPTETDRPPTVNQAEGLQHNP